MRDVDYEFFDHIDDTSAVLDGEGFTGRAVQEDLGAFIYQIFINGSPWGPDYFMDTTGRLLEYSNSYGGGQWVGPRYEWDSSGNLVKEEIMDSHCMLRVVREWDSQGRLTLNEEYEPGELKKSLWEELGPWRWRTIPIPSELGENSDEDAWWQAKDINTLTFDDQGAACLKGNKYSGEAYSWSEGGGLEARTFMNGWENGPLSVWDSNKKLIRLGITRAPYGRVGPWHEWDEQGRLLREVIYDALGNKIIHRELDENQNIVSQERFEPATLMTDPETGEQHPAPWL